MQICLERQVGSIVKPISPGGNLAIILHAASNPWVLKLETR